MTIQLINKQLFIFCINGIQYQFVKPYYLYKNVDQLIKATVKGSTLGWYIQNNFISYNTIKKIYLNQKQKT